MASNAFHGAGNWSASNGSRLMPPMPEGFQSVYETMRIVAICCYVCIIVLSTIGNTTILGIVLTSSNMKTRANYLIVNMAISDLIATIFVIPRIIDVEVTKSYQWKLPEVIAKVFCRFVPFLREVSCSVSAFSMVGIAIDRFFAIALPMINRPSVLKLVFLIPIIWLSSIGLNALYIYAWKLRVLRHAGKTILTCYNSLTNYQEKIFDTTRFVLFLAVPLVNMAVLYTIIAIKMTSHNVPGANVESVARNRRKQNRNIVILAVIIVVSFAICWLPYYIGILLHAFLWASNPVSPDIMIPIFILEKVFTILTYASFSVNPYICLVFSSNFRRNIRRVLCGLKVSSRTTTRATTTSNPNTQRVLSVANLDISLVNINSNREPVSQEQERRQSDNSLETSRVEEQLTIGNAVESDPSWIPASSAMDDMYLGNGNHKFKGAEAPAISASWNGGSNLSRGRICDSYLNEGFQIQH